LLKGVPSPILYGDHVIGKGEALLAAICAEKGEGIISKLARAPYRGARSRNWLKIKCIQRSEFVIVGWSESDKRRGFRSLLLAANDGGRLTYAGKVGTGFNTKMIDELMDTMEPLAVDKAPLEVPRADRKGAHWLKPKLVAEIAYTEVTSDGVLRHPSFIALREDKTAAQVVRETPKKLKPTEKKGTRPTAESFGIRISNPDRIIYPESGLTKGALADYYAAIDPLIMVDAARRPMTLIRCPQGRAKKCFFQKHDSGTMGEHVKHVPVLEKDGETQDYLYFDDIRGLLACVQMGAIEFHGWGSRIDPLECPDRLVFDLDPDVGLDFARVKEAALRLRALLGDLGLTTFPLLSGGKGIHVVVPLDATRDWPTVKSFADRFSRAIAQAEPEMFTANIRKVERKGRIFLDWLRNQRGATAVMPYSARARENAPVAAPIAWEEIDRFQGGNHFTINDIDELLERGASKALAGWGQAQQTLPDL
jgi:bifunctional non-homologous end joining protein LigD